MLTILTYEVLMFKITQNGYLETKMLRASNQGKLDTLESERARHDTRDTIKLIVYVEQNRLTNQYLPIF